MTVLKLLLSVVVVACFVLWMDGLVRWDGSSECNPDPEECETCPFPCERHKQKRR